MSKLYSTLESLYIGVYKIEPNRKSSQIGKKIRLVIWFDLEKNPTIFGLVWFQLKKINPTVYI